MSDKYDYNRFGKKGKRVGQAIVDINSKENLPTITAEEIAESRQSQYIRDLQEAANLGAKEFESPFYVIYLANKEPWSVQLTRGRFVRRQTEPLPENMMTLFPYFSKDCWKIDVKTGSIDYMWTLPSLENFNEILKHKQSYDPALSQWTENSLNEKTPYEATPD